MKPISLVVVTLNAADHIGQCLSSVPFASDIVVLDSGSSDQTVEIAKALGARVFVEEWRGFGPQKRRASELAKTDWILNLDADESLSPEAQQELVRWQGQAQESAAAYALPRLSFHMGRWIRHGGWYPDWQVRLYDRRQCNWSSAQLHEKIETSSVARLRHPILHDVFKDLSHQVNTNNRYSTLGAQTLVEKGQKFRWWKLLFKPKIKFLETYVWKRGFLDGLPGFVIAVGAAYSVFLRWAKLWELERQKLNQRQKGL